MDTYGFRGPTGLDLASARYLDDPVLVLEQMRHYVLLDESTQESPQQTYERRQSERRHAYHRLRETARNPLEAQLVSRLSRSPQKHSAGCGRATSTIS